MSRVKWFVRSFGRGGLLTALFIAATLLSVSIAQASPKYWDCYNLNSSFNWSDATGNWAQNGAQISSYPSSGTGVICIDHGATVTMDVSPSYQALIVGGYSTYSTLELALQGPGTFNLTTPGTTLTLSSTMSVGTNGYGGTVTQSPGTTVTSGADLRLGGNGGGSPSLTGYYHQIGGAASFLNAYFGSNGSSYGKYVQDGGLLTISAGLSGMEFGGSSASAAGGEYHLNGGTLNLAVSNLVYDGYGTTSFEFAGGTLQAGANFVSSGFNASNPMSLKASTNSTVDPNGYTVEFQNGLIGAGSITLGGIAGGTVKFSGTNSYAGDTTVSAGTLAYGADNVIPNGAGKGNVAVNTGAKLDLAGHNATINGLNDGEGGGGTVDNTIASAVTLTVGANDATSAFSGTITNTAGTLSLTKVGTGIVTVSGSLSYGGRTTIQAGTLKAVGAGGIGLIASNGGLDIQHGQAVLDYTGLTDPITLDPIANTLMQDAHANGWVIDSDHPIGSTTAAADPLIHALGWTDTVVDGRTVLTVMYTLCGDANLDGVVNGADLNTVLSNYNKTGMYWSQGDFNYDGTVNGADLNMVLSNYNQSVSVGAAVPEPSTLLLAAAGLAGLLAYAWRKRK